MELQNETKFCIHCNHYRHKGKSSLCAATKTTRLDLVTGEYHEENLVDCASRRKSECGADAKMFKIKLTHIH